jgi:hypothetical protein
MFEDGSLDFSALRSLLDWHVAEGSDGIVIVGTSGESPTVSVEEHCELIKVTVEHIAGRIPVIAGTGGNSTTEAIELTNFAKSVGADASLQVVPYYNKPTQEGQYLHFKAIAEAVDLPMVLYNVPGRSVADMVAEVQKYVPGYRLKQEVQFERYGDNNRLKIPGMGDFTGIKSMIMLEVEGAGDYLPSYSGNLDIMTAAAKATGELLAAKRMAA